MILQFRCPPAVKEKVDRLISKGLYPDFSSFCVTALENQILLEEAEAGTREESQHRKAIRTEAFPATKTREANRSKRGRALSEEKASLPALVRRPENEAARDGLGTEPVVGSSVSRLLSLQALPRNPPLTLPHSFSDLFKDGEPVPVDRWLFGQYNRLLPAKVSARCLSVIALEGKDALLLETAAPRVAEAASKLERYLQSIDERFGIHRDDALATAFPEEGVEGEKGRLRYQSQFVGQVIRGEQGGLLVGLKLATVQVHRNKPVILPTVTGWTFARLSNPILDIPVVSLPAKLSAKEIDFLLRHVMEHVPTEIFAYRLVLSLISEGMNTPDLVGKGLTQYLSPGREPRDEEDFISTQRGGALGRMADLELVTRERQSTRITYQLTARGTAFLNEAGRVRIASPAL